MSHSLFQRLRGLVTCALAATALVMSAPAFSEGDTLRVATEGTYPPWSFKDASGQLQGFDVDIANALCAQMKVKCQIVAQAWDGIIPGLQANRYDAIVASMSTTPARRKQVLFTNKYKDTTSSFIAAKDSGIALRLAREQGLELPLAEATKAQYDKMVFEGLGHLDKSGIAELTFKDRHAEA